MNKRTVAAVLLATPFVSVATAAAASAHTHVEVCDYEFYADGRITEIWFKSGKQLTNPQGNDPNYSDAGFVVTNKPCPKAKDGVDGKDGKNGTDGKPGTPGATGATGPAGPSGAPGAPGAQGPAGPAGADGLAGPAGAAGSNGVDGLPGAPGADGAVGPKGDAGLAGADGADGPLGPVGPQGPQGEAGKNGVDGLNGLNGHDGLSVYAVQGEIEGCFELYLDDNAEGQDSYLGAVCDGKDGVKGVDGKNGVTKTVIITKTEDGKTTTEEVPVLPETGYSSSTAGWLAGSAAFLVLLGVGGVALGRHRKQN